MKRKFILWALVLSLVAVPVSFAAWYDGYFTKVLVKGFIDMPEITAPGAGDTDVGRIYVAVDGTTSTPYFVDQAGTATSMIDSGAVTAWDDIGNPDANGSITFSTYTSTQTGASTAADQWIWDNTAAFGDISIVKIQQKTGNPTNGTLLELTAADTNVDGLVISNTTADLDAANALLRLDLTDTADADGRYIVARDNSAADEQFAVGADGNTVITGTAAGTAALTLTTGDITVTDGALTLTSGTNGDLTVGDDAAIGGNLAMTGNISLDDGVTDSPTLTFQDQTNETAAFHKADSSSLVLTTVAADGLRLALGNLRVGDGAPGTCAMTGESAYVESCLEVDGTITAAAVTMTGLDLGDGDITNVGDIALDTITSDGTTIGIGQTAGDTITVGAATNDFAVLGDNVDFTITDGSDNGFQVANATGPVVYIDLSLGAADALTLGNAAGTTEIASSDWSIGNTGIVAGLGTIASDNLYTFTGGAAGTDAFKVDVAASATGQYFVVDAGAWLGTINEGAGFSFTSDSGAVGEIGQVIRVELGGTAVDNAAISGKALFASDEAGSTPGSYLVHLDSENNGAISVVDGELTIQDDATLEFEGTVDAFETTLDAVDATVDRTILLPDYAGGIPVVIGNSQTQTDATGVGTNTPITGSSLALAASWMSAGKALKWTMYGTSDGSGGQAMTCALDLDGSQFGIVALATGQSDEWLIECTLNEHTDLANQKIVCTLQADTEANQVEYDVDVTNMAAGATTVRMECDTNSATDHIYVESVMIEHWEQ